MRTALLLAVTTTLILSGLAFSAAVLLATAAVVAVLSPLAE
jgi:hypothetical protein